MRTKILVDDLARLRHRFAVPLRAHTVTNVPRNSDVAPCITRIDNAADQRLVPHVAEFVSLSPAWDMDLHEQSEGHRAPSAAKCTSESENVLKKEISMSFLVYRVSLCARSMLRALFAVGIGQQLHTIRQVSILPLCGRVHFRAGKHDQKGDLNVFFSVSCLLVCQIGAGGVVHPGNRTVSAHNQTGQHPATLRRSALRDRKTRSKRRPRCPF